MKQAWAWTLVVIGLGGVLIGYLAIWTLLTTLAAGIVWWASAALMVSGPISLVGGLLARRPPRQMAALWIGVISSAAWLTLWVLKFTVLGFRFTPEF